MNLTVGSFRINAAYLYTKYFFSCKFADLIINVILNPIHRTMKKNAIMKIFVSMNKE